MKCIPDHAGCRVLSERTTKSKAASPRAAWEDPHKWHFLAALWKHSWNVSSYQPQLHTSIKSNKQDKEQRTFTSIFPWHPSTEERVQTLKLMCNLTYYRDSLITASLRGSDSIQLNKKKNPQWVSKAQAKTLGCDLDCDSDSHQQWPKSHFLYPHLQLEIMFFTIHWPGLTS